ncbi:hypothetical protein HYPSUDRAFT_279435 [Hypholoma sublateritium FD-334 SS-4]|uniref:MalT-like TPR region domain-containing protein n=1 Tax=Hypholoma sublateritium (strain FD-334 SS-4) TaxID=945553 RepID=A0A0D2LG48_HYPSF|nr:hypothetical protein HYPSUDRAFT_279435 [Hypholoma sublateritium FD-334 SS-4]
MMTMWPAAVRQDLRNGLRAKRKGDFEIAIQYMTRAWNEARAMPRDAFNEQALLKISGIGIALAGTLEEAGQLVRAFEMYQDVLQYIRTAHLGPVIAKNTNADLDTLQASLSGPESYRTVALAYRLGELANKLSMPKEEEKWLVVSVEALLRLLNAPPPLGALSVPPEKNSKHTRALIKQLGLPVMFYQHNIAAPFEALGSFYARTGNPTYALPLYLQAISILIPTPPAVTNAEDYCRGAALMGNISEMIVRYQIRDGEPAEALVQAEAWANKGLELATTMREKVSKKCEACEEAYAVLLYNLAVVRELSGDKNRARQLLSESLEQSKAMGLDEGIKLANRALESLGVPPVETTARSLVSDEDLIASASLE